MASRRHLRVAVYRSMNQRSKIICHAISRGINAAGDHATIVPVGRYEKPIADACVHYGMREPMRSIHRDYVAEGKPAVYIDLGYWRRWLDGPTGRWEGYHKVSVNALHPSAYFQSRPHPPDRFAACAVVPQRRREGRYILLAGMSEKAAHTNDLIREEYERATITELRRHTDREIVYRPKPSWREARPIEGTTYSTKRQTLDAAIAGAHAVVTHHSNVAVDGIVAGVPAFCVEGVALPVANTSLSKIENPAFPDEVDRWQWLADVAYCQWSVAEMRSGACWDHLKREHLVG